MDLFGCAFTKRGELWQRRNLIIRKGEFSANRESSIVAFIQTIGRCRRCPNLVEIG